MNIDNRFIESINNRKERGWKELYHKFYPALCNYAMHIIGDPEEAEDVVQECFVRIWENGIHFPDPPSLTAYLYRVVYTRSLNFVRDKGYAHKLHETWGEKLIADNEIDPVIEIAVEEDVVNKFYEALSGLSEQQRQVLLMSIEGKTIKGIAEELHVSENTIKTQKKRAYTYVREQLGEQLALLIFFLYS